MVSATCTGQLASTLGGQSAYVLRQRAARTSVSRRRSITSTSTLSGPELHEYMTRIPARGQKPRHLPPALSTLKELQLAHVKGIPFEKPVSPPPISEQRVAVQITQSARLSFRSGLCLHSLSGCSTCRRCRTRNEKVFEKLVRKPCGGCCFEQNTLFAAALRSLGYAVFTAAARCSTCACPDVHGLFPMHAKSGSKGLLCIRQCTFDPTNHKRCYILLLLKQPL